MSAASERSADEAFPARAGMERWPSVEETLRVVQGVLGPEPAEFLSEDVVLFEAVSERSYRGRAGVIERLAHVQALFDQRDEVRLSVDEGRGVAEWLYRSGAAAVAMVCVFEIETSKIRRARLYYDAKALRSIEERRNGSG